MQPYDESPSRNGSIELAISVNAPSDHPTPIDLRGVTVHAVDIPLGAEPLWENLGKAYGATITFVQDGQSFFYFPSWTPGWDFGNFVSSKIGIPKIWDYIEEYRTRFDARVKDFKGDNLTEQDLYLLQNRKYF